MNSIPIIQIEARFDPSNFAKHQGAKFRIATNPNSTNYDDVIPIFVPFLHTTSHVEEVCYFLKTFAELRSHKNWRDGSILFRNLTLLVKDRAKAIWEESYRSPVDTLGATDESFDLSLENFIARAFHMKTASRQKKYLRTVKKPNNMTVASFWERWNELNTYLPYMRGSNEERTMISVEEQASILEYAVSTTWRDKFQETPMSLQDYTVNDIQTYFERLEELDTKKARRNGRTSTTCPSRDSTRDRGRRSNNRPDSISSRNQGRDPAYQADAKWTSDRDHEPRSAPNQTYFRTDTRDRRNRPPPFQTPSNPNTRPRTEENHQHDEDVDNLAADVQALNLRPPKLVTDHNHIEAQDSYDSDYDSYTTSLDDYADPYYDYDSY